jgi:hypothetical protein
MHLRGFPLVTRGRAELERKSPRPARLPSWSAGLPLWAADRWLWVDLSVRGTPRVVQWGAARGEPGAETAQSSSLWPLIVLHGRPRLHVPDRLWRSLEATLEPGGLLFVCNMHDPSLSQLIKDAGDDLQPGEWHLIERAEEGNWRLRPDSWRAGTWFNRHVSTPHGLRSWIRQWMTLGLHGHGNAQKVTSLPVWREQRP